MKNPRRTIRPGPAILVTAAFIGPGTVLTASTAGALHGYTLLWAVLFSVLATIVLQEMAARLGIVSGGGLAEAVRATVPAPLLRRLLLALILGGILFGNAAYQTGNLLGAATGLEILTAPAGPPEVAQQQAAAETGVVWRLAGLWSLVIAAAALVLIWIGRFDVLQWSLMVLVAVMGVLFLVSAVLSGPDLGALLQGCVPRLFSRPADPAASSAGWFVVGLIGTTVVPYNLFLHASGAATRWAKTDDPARAVRQSLVDTAISVGLGGLMTASILVTAAVAFEGGGALESVRDIARQLRPTLGSWAETVFAVGLFSAGLTSSITAPIAAAYATAGCFGWPARLSDWRLKAVATAVVLVGLWCALQFGGSPQQAIIVAQVANGLLLPVIAIYLLLMVNRATLMQQLANGWWGNLLGGAIVLVTGLIAARQLISVAVKITQLGGD